jgi:5'-3' exonuclease
MELHVFLIADGNNLAWAGFHALRKPMGAETPGQKIRATLLGLTQSVIGLVVRAGEPPSDGPAGTRPLWARSVTRMAIAFDEGRPLRRRTIFPGYQLGRESNPSFAENEAFVLEGIRQFIEAAACLPMEILRGVNTEADDLVAALVTQSDAPAVRIASTDRDFLQLVDERVSVYSPVKRIVIDPSNFTAATAPTDSDGRAVAFPRERYLDYRVASGDPSDDLTGIPGVGAITAARLLAAAPLDAYLDKPRLAVATLDRRNAKLETALASGAAREVVDRNRRLMDLRLGAQSFPRLGELRRFGEWNETGFRGWLAEQRVAGIEVESACAALGALAKGVS